MSNSNILPNLVAGNSGAVDLGLNNLGIKPVGNGAGSQRPGPSGIGKIGNSTPIPVSTGPISLNPAANPPVLAPGTTGSVIPMPVTSPSGGSSLLPTNGVNPSPVATDPTTGLPISNSNPSIPYNQQNLDKQMKDEYGKGEGSLISGLVSSLGSSDDAYMQAYEKAMAQPNAEQMATLETDLGNEGISGDSSTAAIAKADLLSGETADEGLQEQQLKQNDLAQLLGLTESLEGVSNKAQQDTGWSIFGSVLGDVGGAVAGALI